jgi:bifunctional non-homologous end joining protein LigD
MLARTGRGVPVDLGEWAIEPKWDGWRCLVRISHGRLRLTSCWRNDLTPMFPELGELPEELAEQRVLLDGEVVALRPDGSQDFHALTARRRDRRTRLAFMSFDLLHIDGHDLTRDPYAARRHALEELGLKQDRWLTTPSLPHEAGAALYAFTLAQGWEGIVAKRLDSPYRPAGRNGTWLKAKHPHARDLQSDRSTWTPRERNPVEAPLMAYR